MTLTIENRSVPLLCACLALGTLTAIQAGSLPPEAGIWTLGRPTFWEPLVEAGLVPDDLVEVLQVADELNALQQLAPDAYKEQLASSTGTTLRVIAQDGTISFDATWATE